MRISVVINTYNRAHSIEATLQGLLRQTHPDLEVIVVNGPSSDDTAQVLRRWSHLVRLVDCPEAHLGKSRNLGIAAAAGEVVAFIDDDAVPETTWLADLNRAYEDPSVSGAGGLVYDHTGMALQYRFSLCDRVGDPVFDQQPGEEHQQPGADPFVYLQGTNCSFRRSALEEIGGFDEEIEYYLDETEVCLQLVDHGHRLLPIDGAAVHHRYLPSHLRQDANVWLNPYPQTKNRLMFALRYGTVTRPTGQVLRTLFRWTGGTLSAGEAFFQAGRITAEQLRFLEERLDEGIEAGIQRADQPRRSVMIPPADSAAYLPLARLVPKQGPLRLCLLSEGYPPGPTAGIGRFTADLAAGLAARGHEIHVVTRTAGPNRVDYEDGVWVHRIVGQDRRIAGLERSPLRGNLQWCAALYNEVLRLHQRLPVDLVSAPIWNAEGAFCTLDPNLRTITSLHTTLDMVRGVLPSWEGDPHIDALAKLEDLVLATSDDLHANSEAMAASVQAQVPTASPSVHLVRHGLADRAAEAPIPEAERTGVTVLFVGRLERRKGADLLLEIAPALLDRHPGLRLVLVGPDSPNTEIGETYRAQFAREMAARPEVLGRVLFEGELEDSERDAWYQRADLFVAPSRFESFGLVLLEAMAFGLPIVSCRTGGIPEVVADNALLVPPDDADALQEAIDELVSDEARRRTMGKRSRQLYEESWTLDRWAERVEAAYAMVAATPGAAGVSLLDRLSSLVVDIAEVPPDRGASVAAALLDRQAYPVDQLSLLADLLGLDDQAFVRGCYAQILGREADESGLEHALQMLRSGTDRIGLAFILAGSVEGQHRAALNTWLDRLAAFVRSLAPGEVMHALEQLDDGGFLDALYRWVLLRSPDVDGKANRLLELGRGRPRLSVALEVISSDEAVRCGAPAEAISQLLDAVEPPVEHDQVADVPRAVARSIPHRAVARSIPRRAISRVAGRASAAVGLPALTADIEALEAVVERNECGLRELTDEVAGSRRTVEALATEVRSNAEAVKSVAEVVEAGTIRVNENLHQSVATLGQWLDVLGRKQLAMAGEMRERLPARPLPEELPEPQLVNPEAVASAARSQEGIRLNLGCGEKPLPGYLNVDARAIPDVDVVADIRRLPFEPGTVSEVASAHLVEHFRTTQLVGAVLPYWLSLLRPGGAVRVVCPNWESMIRLAADGQISFQELKQVTFGAQDYGGDDHFAMYSLESMRRVLEEAGFVDVEVVVAERQNGASVEMELVAYKPAG